MDACKGTTLDVTVNPVATCPSCSGTGLKRGAKRATCNTCHGTGTQTFVIDSGFQMASTCSACFGTGSTIPRGSQCSTCEGQGHIRTKKIVKVDIPPGESCFSYLLLNLLTANFRGGGWYDYTCTSFWRCSFVWKR